MIVTEKQNKELLKEMKKNRTNLNGAKNGEATSIAISSRFREPLVISSRYSNR
ncbi:MAG: hypothetical protein CM15mP22_4900 [Gammaproteobacteria bacterium]|nr:MAG: hypothetical protein CM15mP22_4900 [Gammaproteobacteria bacterium]